MNKYDAAKVLNLTGTFSPEELKIAYLKVCFQYHPDRNPAGLEMMKMINVAYSVLEKEKTPFTWTDTQAYGEAVNSALSAIVGNADLEIEICGAWVWVSGNTKDYRNILKESGFLWAPKKMRWYFRPEGYRSLNRGRWSMEAIRANYGSYFVKLEGETYQPQLLATA